MITCSMWHFSSKLCLRTAEADKVMQIEEVWNSFLSCILCMNLHTFTVCVYFAPNSQRRYRTDISCSQLPTYSLTDCVFLTALDLKTQHECRAFLLIVSSLSPFSWLLVSAHLSGFFIHVAHPLKSASPSFWTHLDNVELSPTSWVWDVWKRPLHRE